MWDIISGVDLLIKGQRKNTIILISGNINSTGRYICATLQTLYGDGNGAACVRCFITERPPWWCFFLHIFYNFRYSWSFFDILEVNVGYGQLPKTKKKYISE